MGTREDSLTKRLTGIDGLDAVTRGGLPAAGAVLVIGGSGTGKTALALQILAHAAQRDEGGVYLTFEESREQILRDAASFSWGDALTDTTHCEIVDARRRPDAIAAGGFDLDGLTAVISHCVERVGASWVVLDGIDQLLRLQRDPERATAQLVQLSEFCEQRGLTLLITAKPGANGTATAQYLDGIDYMLSTTLLLSADVIGQRLNRRFRIAKYRGTGHVTDELSVLMDNNGLHLPYGEQIEPVGEAPNERVGTGIPRLDRLLAGGFYRGSTTLISGQPGTSKTTLAASVAEAAAMRGERVLFFSFDEFARQIVRNVGSVGIDLQPHMDAGNLVLVARSAWAGLVEEHYLELTRRIEAFKPHFLVLDPASALLKSAHRDNAFLAIERLILQTRSRGITTVLTSLSETDDPVGESTLSHTSTLADTWIVLRYQARGGERNRLLSVVKSRGTAHSSQVRELVVSSDGMDLADVYAFGTDVLTGAARAQKEKEERDLVRRGDFEREQRRRELKYQVEDARARLGESRAEVERLIQMLETEQALVASDDQAAERHASDVLRRRGSDSNSSDASDQGGAEQ